MRKLFFMLSFFVGTLEAQISMFDTTSTSKLTELLLKDSTKYEPRNEIAIANFFPMIFQQTWAGSMGAIYKRHILKYKIAIRAQINGNINETQRMAFDNNTLATKIGDEFNNFITGSDNFNFGLGLQKSFYLQDKFNMYHFIDLFRGGYNYNQISVNSISEVNGANGKTILSFVRYETGQSSVSYSMNYGLGLNYNFNHHFSAQIETSIGGNYNSVTTINQRKTIELNIATNSYYISQLDETKMPEYKMTNFNLTPITTLYFSYKF